MTAIRCRHRALTAAAPVVLALLASSAVLTIPLATLGAPQAGAASAPGWTPATLPSGTPELFAVACPSATLCVSVGGTSSAGAVFSSDGGTTWAAAQMPSGTPPLFGVSCPSTTFCMATGFSGTAGSTPSPGAVVSTDGGQTWSAVTAPPAAGSGAYSIWCANSSDCWVGGAGAIDSTTDGGASWTTTVLDTAANSINVQGISGLWFSNAEDGWATGYNGCGGAGVTNCGGWVFTTNDGGATWNVALSEGTDSALGSPMGISCTSASSCFVLGYDSRGAHVTMTTNAGQSWASEPLPGNADTVMTGVVDQNGITCVTGTSTCYVAGWNGGSAGSAQPYTNARAVVDTTTNGGATWVPQATSTSVAAGYAIGCSSAQACIVVGLSPSLGAAGNARAAAMTTSDGGVLPLVTGVSASSGPLAGGSTVTISGAYFTGASSVSFGGVASSSFSVVSPSEITAQVPPATSPGMVNVQVTTATGTSPAYDQASSGTAGTDGYLYVSPGAYNPVTPYRICDTRSGNSTPCSGNVYGEGGRICLEVAGSNPPGQTSGGVPSSGVEAAVLNVTVVDNSPPPPYYPGGYLTVSPAGAATPVASNLNFVGNPSANAVTANLVEVAVGTAGSVCFTEAGGLSVYESPNGGTAVSLIVDVEGWVATSSTTGDGYQPMVPTRICDTRPGNPSGLSGAAAQCNGHTLAGGTTLPVQVSGIAGVPSGATAAVLNVTVTNTSSAGYLTVWPAGQPQPVASNVNWSPGATVANRVIVPLGSAGVVDVFNSAGSTDVIVDIGGYYGSTGLMFTPSAPTRICDTRPGDPSGLSGAAAQCNGKTLAAGSTLGVAVGGVGGVPAGAAALVANVTVADTTSGGYLTVWPSGQSRPTASDINWSPGKVVPNLVVVKIGSGGSISVFNSNGSTDVIVDVAGWYS